MSRRLFYILNFIVVLAVSGLLVEQIDRLIHEDFKQREEEGLRVISNQAKPLFVEKLKLFSEDLVRVASSESQIHQNYFKDDIVKKNIFSPEFKDSPFVAIQLFSANKKNPKTLWQSLKEEPRQKWSKYFLSKAWQSYHSMPENLDYYWQSIEDNKGKAFWIHFVRVESMDADEQWQSNVLAAIVPADYFFDWAQGFKGSEGNLVIFNDQKRALIHNESAYTGHSLEQHPFVAKAGNQVAAAQSANFTFKKSESWLGRYVNLPKSNLSLAVMQPQQQFFSWSLVFKALPLLLLLAFVGFFHESILKVLGYSVYEFSPKQRDQKVMQLEQELRDQTQLFADKVLEQQQKFESQLQQLQQDMDSRVSEEKQEFIDQYQQSIKGSSAVALGQLQILKAKERFAEITPGDLKKQLEKIEQEIRKIRNIQESDFIEQQHWVSESKDLGKLEVQDPLDDSDLIIEGFDEPAEDQTALVIPQEELDEPPRLKVEGTPFDLGAWIEEQKESGFDVEKSEIFTSEKTQSQLDIKIRNPRKASQEIEH